MLISGQMRYDVAVLSTFKIALLKIQYLLIDAARRWVWFITMFPRNPQPGEFTDLIEKFKDIQVVQNLVKEQMIAGAKFSLIWVQIRHSKINLDDIVRGVFSRCSKRRINLDRFIETVQGPVEQIIDKLLMMDSDFYRGRQHDNSTSQNIDRWM
jgi:hypothetical protein